MFFKATREARASSDRAPGKRNSTVHFRCSSWQMLQGRGVMPQEPGGRSEPSKAEDKWYSITQFLQNMLAKVQQLLGVSESIKSLLLWWKLLGVLGFGEGALFLGFLFYFVLNIFNFILYALVWGCQIPWNWSCELPYWCWGLNPGPLEEQPVLLTTELSLQPLWFCFLIQDLSCVTGLELAM